MKWLQQLVSDGEQPSTYRVLMFVVLVPAMFVWSWLSIKQGAFIVPDTKVSAILISIFGGKALQSFAENRPPADTIKVTVPTPIDP